MFDDVTFPKPARGSCWVPAADVYRTPSGWLVKFDLAGVNPSDLELQRHGHRLCIRGTRRDVLVQTGVQSYSLEISYNRFERTVHFPTEIESAHVSTEYRDGMLLVRLEQV
ncbi:MAG: hypothetical protein KatS3mg111_2272 [Pirellulaceae bacterium]|nr:MAG: hypothetical protein KatS3mg111_2272 [Pirellulaceae bacterium]